MLYRPVSGPQRARSGVEDYDDLVGERETEEVALTCMRKLIGILNIMMTTKSDAVGTS